MKKLLSIVVLFVMVMTMTSCESVKSGHKAAFEDYGGKADLTKVFGEGMHWDLEFLFGAKLIEYNVKEKTITEKYTFNDKDNMEVPVEFSLDYRVSPLNVNKLHVGVDDYLIKIRKTLKSAGKEVVAQYSAVELNVTKRTEAESKLAEIMKRELPEFYIEFARIQMTDVDIPAKVAQLAEETAIQLGKNELATKKEAEQVALGKALEAKAKAEYNAEVLNAQTKELKSRPRYLELFRAETDRMWAISGKSPYGNNNVFGAGTSVIKGLK